MGKESNKIKKTLGKINPEIPRRGVKDFTKKMSFLNLLALAALFLSIILCMVNLELYALIGFFVTVLVVFYNLYVFKILKAYNPKYYEMSFAKYDSSKSGLPSGKVQIQVKTKTGEIYDDIGFRDEELGMIWTESGNSWSYKERDVYTKGGSPFIIFDEKLMVPINLELAKIATPLLEEYGFKNMKDLEKLVGKLREIIKKTPETDEERQEQIKAEATLQGLKETVEGVSSSINLSDFMNFATGYNRIIKALMIRYAWLSGWYEAKEEGSSSAMTYIAMFGGLGVLLFIAFIVGKGMGVL
jgi:hypothetical protein